MRRSNQITVDLGDALHSNLEALVKSTQKTKSDLVKLAVWSMCNAKKADISISVHELSKLTSGEKRSAKKKPHSLTPEDHILISTWRKTFNIPEKARIFAPAILNTIWNARRAGLTQEELITLVELAPRNRWVREQVTAGVAPPLSAILSEKMIPHLLMLVPQSGEQEGTEELEDYKINAIERYWDFVFKEDQDQFRDAIMGYDSTAEVDSAIKHWVDNVKP